MMLNYATFGGLAIIKSPSYEGGGGRYRNGIGSEMKYHVLRTFDDLYYTPLFV